MTFHRTDTSRPSILRDYITGYLHEAGDIVTYEELADMFDFQYPTGDLYQDEQIIKAIRKVVTQTNKYLSDDGNWKHLTNVPNVGYRIASPTDLRNEAIGRSQHIVHEQRKVIRATEKVSIHPDSTQSQRTQASNNLTLQNNLLMLIKKARRVTRRDWQAPEQPTVVEE